MTSIDDQHIKPPAPPSANLPFRICAPLYLAIAAVYLFTATGRTAGSDQLAMFNVAQSLATHASLSADPCTPDPKANHCVPGIDGKNYAGFGLVPSILAVPAYAAGRAAAVLLHRNVQIIAGVTVSLWHALLAAVVPVVFALWLFRIGVSTRTALWGALLYAFASPAWSFSKELASEPYFALGLIGCCFFLAGEDRARALLAAGACFGLACGSRVYGLILAPAIALYGLMLWKDRQRAVPQMLRNLVALGLPVAAAVALIALSNYARFGSMFKTGYHLNFPTTSALLSTPLLQGARNLLINPEVGLLIYVPWVLAVPFLWAKLRARRHSEAVLLLGMFGINFLFFAKYTAWHGGWSIGPRMLYATLPFLLLPLAVWFDDWTNLPNLARRLALGLLFLTFLIQALLVTYPEMRYYTMDAYNQQHGLHPWWSGVPLAEAVAALPELFSPHDPPAGGPAHQFLLTFPNSINLTRADLWLVKTALLGSSLAAFAGAAVLLLIFLFAIRRAFERARCFSGIAAARSRNLAQPANAFQVSQRRG